ncbi:MAG: hypothetical protein FWC32_05370 [Firmicutes bacterium]|nr:hypothetical protein [Bacillota bacterium]
MQKFSIINPEGMAEKDDGFNKHMFSQVFAELKISRFLHIKPVLASGTMTTYNLAEFLTADTEIIGHRLDIFEDLLTCKGLIELIRDTALPAICNISNLSGSSDGDYFFLNQFHSVRRLSVYAECIDQLHGTFSKLSLNSRGMRSFAEKIAAIYNSEEFINLKANLAKISMRINNVKSVTLGINLGDGMRIDNMGIVSMNEEPFKSGKLLDKLLSADFSRSEEYTLLTPLEPIFRSLDTSQKYEVNRAFKSAFNTLLSGTLKNVPKDVTVYMKAQTQFLVDILPEICFLVAGYEMMSNLKSHHMTVCKPQISTTRETRLENLYHPILLETLKQDKIKRNSVAFDSNGMFYVLTGANSGGKSVFLHSIGVAQVLFQLGLYVPAGEAVMLPVDYLCMHLATESTINSAAGRLEHECIALNQIIKTITSASMVLVDEAFSSTSAYDGSILAEELLKHFVVTGCKGVFSTHIHDLPIERVNAYGKDGKVKVDTLVATSVGGQRMYRIVRQKPEGLSHAKDIAQKYGLLPVAEEPL